MSEDLSENLSFFLNNLTEDNVEQTAEYLKELSATFNEETEKWLALFLIRRRVAAEANHVGLYVRLSRLIESLTFQASLLTVTVKYAKQLMDGAPTAANQKPRDILRNLGTFLGMLTWGNDIDIPESLLDLHELLKDAEREGQEKIEKVLPFVVNVLKSCKTSKVFKPNHKRIAPIFVTLKGIHALDDMKMTLCFEIESLFEELRAPTPPPSTPNSSSTTSPEHIRDMTGMADVSHQNFFNQGLYQQAPPLFAQFQQQVMENPMVLQALMNPAYLQQTQMQSELFKNLHIPGGLPKQGMMPSIPEHQLPISQPQYQHSHYQVEHPPMFKGSMDVSSIENGSFNSSKATDDYEAFRNNEEMKIWDPNPTMFQEANAFVAKDNKLVWQLLDAIDFTCSPVFQLYNTAKGRVIESIYGYLTDVEKMLAPILKRLCESLTFSAASIMHRDFAFDSLNDIATLKSINRSVYKALLFALYYRKNSNDEAYSHLRRTMEHAIGRAMEESAIVQRAAPNELKWTMEMSARQFAHANSRVVGTFICEVLERFSQELGDLQFSQYVEERKNNPNRVGLGRFAYNPTTKADVDSKLPESLRFNNKEDYSKVFAEFEALSATLKANLMNSLKNMDSKVFNDVQKEDVMGTKVAPRPSSFSRSGYVPVQEHSDLKFDKKPVDAFRSEVLVIFREWCVSSKSAEPARKDCFHKIVEYVYSMNLLTNMNDIGRFFEICLVVCIDLSEHLENEVQSKERPERQLQLNRQLYNHVKALVLLVDALAEEQERRDHTRTRFVAQFINVVIKSHVKKFAEWQNPSKLRNAVFYHTYYWLVTTQTMPHAQKHLRDFVDIFVTAIQSISPLNLPAFVYSYLSIIAHPQLMRTILKSTELDDAKSANFYMMLLKPLLEHHKKLFESMDDICQPAVHHLNKGLSRLFVYLQHDFPRFFSRKFNVIVKTIPLLCIHLRNLVLGASPVDVTGVESNIGFERCCMKNSEMNDLPDIHSELLHMAPEDVKKLIAAAVTEKNNPQFVALFMDAFKDGTTNGRMYNYSKLIDFLTCFGAVSVEEAKYAKVGISLMIVSNNKMVKILQQVLNLMDNEGIHAFLNATFDQLRYPNAHTAFFCGFLLVLFETGKENVKEIMARIMFERILTFPPYPFGLKLLLSELFTNESYGFFANKFIHSSPMIEKLCLEAASLVEVGPSELTQTPSYPCYVESPQYNFFE
ncbi:unnamed protein product [Bursaphelenchus okinawaensis]|uniref:Not1 domain-containing protein n=1 Tax=Bursaphelenchus okinawaensis TaxID=465554 RepID=A0A811LA65_9BILA|nr:unnamed protein product [Bursaphelenchus okinawaensis]CAG9119506.1 unnamed protein product [Bursaphelenchus okinawaensis]